MSAPTGNQFWKARTKHGRNKLFADAETLWDACCEYFQWVEDNPLWEAKYTQYQGEPIDITDDQSSGWRTLDSDVGRRSVDISIEGFVTEADSTLRDALLAASPSLLLTDITVTFPNGDSLAGDFFLSSLEESGPENEANGFSAELQSSGTMNFTPAP